VNVPAQQILIQLLDQETMSWCRTAV